MPTPEATIPRDSLTLAIAAHEQAIALREATRLPAAERACRRALLLYTRAEGRDHPDVANALVELGRILEARDRLRPARACHVRALEILGPPARGRGGDPDMTRLRVRARIFVAGIDRALGAHAAADREFHGALKEVTRVFGARDLDAAGILNNLGVLRKYQGRWAEATRFYRRALPLIEASGDQDALATLFHNMGGIEHARGRYAAGEPHARRSVELREKIAGPDTIAVAADVAALAALIEGQGRLEEAAALYERALAVFRRKLGRVNAEVALNLSSLAALRQEQGRVIEAERLYDQAVPLQEKVFGRGHPEVALTLHNLAHLERERGNLTRALALYTRAWRSFDRVLGARHPHTRLAASNLRVVKAEHAATRKRPKTLKAKGRTGR
jgi:tetratricopeptide (TPR) repeat protein